MNWLLVLCLLLSTATWASAEKPTLVIATYDSFVAKHGLGPEIFPLFEKKCGCKVQVLASGDGAQLLSKLQLDAERGKPTADVVLGLDQSMWERARPYLEEWGKWEPRGYSQVIKDARVAPGFLPFDYGVFAFMIDREQLAAAKLEAPRKLADLLKPEWRRNVILEDPRTSTPGLAFLLYANEVGGGGFWPKFRSQWLTLAPGWDGAYGLFLKKEAPLVWSYTTSQGYHEEHGDRTDAGRRYRALVFEEGNPVQIEGAAIVKGPFSGKGDIGPLNYMGMNLSVSTDGLVSLMSRDKLAHAFLEFLLSPEVQSRIPLKNWMLPVMLGTKLPPSFEHLPQPIKLVRTPTDAHKIERELTDWKRAIGRGAAK